MREKGIKFASLYRYALAIGAGLLLSVPWYDRGTGLVLFVGLLPVLHLVDVSLESGKKRLFSGFGILLLLVAVWATASGWWLKNATVAGILFLIALDTVLYGVVLLLYKLVRMRLGRWMSYLALVVFWIAFEYIYLNAELSVPWINLGNGLSHNLRLIQWYSVTGTLGGTLWVLLVNILLYQALVDFRKFRNLNSGLLAALLVVLVAPALLSLRMYGREEKAASTVTVLTVQPNVDPYEKFVSYSPAEQTALLKELYTPYLKDKPDYILTPETAITGYGDVDHLSTDPNVREVEESIRELPGTRVILGMTLLKRYGPDEVPSPSAQQDRRGNFYDTYNSAVQINGCDLQTYHKSKLFPGVETMPYANSLKFLRRLILNLGGTTRSHAVSAERNNLTSCDGKDVVAPVICWENIYGEFVGGFVRNGAGIIFNITNEGWWGDTPGHKMFMRYARLRAIETHRWVVRSANTGISAFISPRGEVTQALSWDKKGVLIGQAGLYDDLTFYVKHGDYLGWVARLLSTIMLGVLLVHGITRRWSKRPSTKR
ncbi:MAG: apolipoprotein N-acyltransferase [Bacteroidales bacterium]